ncbi:hypothetical protein INT48_003048, partial [Thamnidium elegans]
MTPQEPPKWARELINEVKRIGDTVDVLAQNQNIESINNKLEDISVDVAAIRDITNYIPGSLDTSPIADNAVVFPSFSVAPRNNLIAKPKEIKKAVIVNVIAEVVGEGAEPNKIYEDLRREINNLVNAAIEENGTFVAWTSLSKQHRTALLGEVTAFAERNGLQHNARFERNWVVDYLNVAYNLSFGYCGTIYDITLGNASVLVKYHLSVTDIQAKESCVLQESAHVCLVK